MEGLVVLCIFFGVLILSTVIQELILFVWSGMREVLRVLLGLVGVACLLVGIFAAMGWIVIA